MATLICSCILSYAAGVVSAVAFAEWMDKHDTQWPPKPTPDSGKPDWLDDDINNEHQRKA